MPSGGNEGNSAKLARGRERAKWERHYLSIGCTKWKAIGLSFKKVP